MQSLVPQGSPYTADQVKAALHAVHGSRRLSYTFDLLDSADNVIRDITDLVVAEQSTIRMDSTAADIKRSATFQIKDDGTIDWLKNRIRPWAVLQMPAVLTYSESTQADFAKGTLTNVQAAAGGVVLGQYANLLSSTQSRCVDGWKKIEAGGNNTTLTMGADGSDKLRFVLNAPAAGYGTGVGIQLPLYNGYTLTLSADITVSGIGAGRLSVFFEGVGGGSPTYDTAGAIDIRADGSYHVVTTHSFRSGDTSCDLQFRFTTGTPSGAILENRNAQVEYGNVAHPWVMGGTSGYFPIGSRTSPPIDLSSLGSVQSSSISWTADTPAGTSLGLQVSTDGGATWRDVTNGGALLAPGDTADSILLRENLSTTDTSMTPTLRSVTITALGSEMTGEVRWPLGIFLPVAPGRSYQGPSRYRQVTAYDKMYILKQSGPNARYVVDEGTNIAGAVVTVLQNLGISKINIAPCDKTMPTWYDWTPDVSWLDVCNTLLKIINYEPLFVDEQGYFTSRPATTPQQRAEEYTYATDDWSIIAPGATDELDYFSVPNQWVGIVSEPDKVTLTYTYTNSNPASPTSTVSRGGLVIRKTINVDAADLDSLQGIVQQQAYTDSQVARKVTFKTAAMPIHSYNDVYHLKHDRLGIDGKYQELSWEMPLKCGAEMVHTAQEVISI